jgi:hypothetical protein
MKTIADIGIQIPRILLPGKGVDMSRWAVIACDQFTSQPMYWDQVQQAVGAAPSTLNMILPEVYLGQPDEPTRIQRTQETMRAYLESGLFETVEHMVYVERTTGDEQRGFRTRRGIMLCLDLEEYDFNRGAQSLIRATEGTILDRLPPRIRIRSGAQLEVPHIMVLIDDPDRTVIEPVAASREALSPLYNFDLMLGSGHIAGYAVDRPEVEAGLIQALKALVNPDRFRAHYGVGPEHHPLLFASGDGNHSMATAKAIWDEMKGRVPADHPARYVLVEVENLHDRGLQFEPIHRVLFHVKRDILQILCQHFQGRIEYYPSPSREAMVSRVDHHLEPGQVIGLVTPGGFGILEILQPTATLPVGTLQPFLDDFLRSASADKIDYVHDEEVVCTLGRQPGNCGFYLPAMHKSDLFKSVILEGTLPRKAFSMGEAREKRFYLEARQITA